MTDLSKLSIPELREQAKSIIYALNAFDELAGRYRRLEEAQRGTCEELKITPTSTENKIVLSVKDGKWTLTEMTKHNKVLQSVSHENAAPLPPSEVSEGDKELLRLCDDEIMAAQGYDTPAARIANALKRRIEGE